MAAFSLSGSTAFSGRHSIVTCLRSAYAYHSKIGRFGCASLSEPNQNGGKEQEKFISIREVLDEAATLGDDFIFEDDSDAPVWELEEKLGADALPGNILKEKPCTGYCCEYKPQHLAYGIGDGAMPQIKQSADIGAVDITSAYSAEQGFQEISIKDFHRSLSDYSLVMDVRTADEFHTGHVPSAINVPLQELNKESISNANLQEFQDRRVAVICASGGRSAQATVRLTKVLGFQDVTNVTGGTLTWISAGFPVDR